MNFSRIPTSHLHSDLDDDLIMYFDSVLGDVIGFIENSRNHYGIEFAVTNSVYLKL